MSTKINISNYDQYALDYLEGSLDPALLAAFEQFLDAHPDIRIELIEMGSIEPLVADPSQSYASASELKKVVQTTAHIHEGNYESYFVASVEDMLTTDEAAELEQFLAQNGFLQRDHQLYLKTKIRPNENEVFPDRSVLKRPLPLWEEPARVVLRVAAIAVVALGGLTIWNALNERLYVPRHATTSFSLMESVPNNPIQQQPSAIEKEKTAIFTAELAQTERVAPPATLPLRGVQMVASPSSEPAEREMLAYAPVVSDWIGEAPIAPRPVEELTLAQFIGKQFFGVDPQQAPTTKDLIREGLVKTIDHTEAFELRTTSNHPQKRSLDFLAGNFEFKRVTYK
jgi:hypothetical protein